MPMVKLLSYRIKDIVWIVALLSVALVVALFPMESMDEGSTLCLWTNLTGKNCYGCGISRAIIYFFRGDFTTAFHYNRLVILVAPLLLFYWLKQLLLSSKNIYKALKIEHP